MKRYRLSVSDEAIIEIQEAIDWYDEKQKGLGKRFLTSVKQSFTTIKRNPFFATKYDFVRCYSVRRFPYLIHFTISETNNQVQNYPNIRHLDKRRKGTIVYI